ncbi:MAG: permease-like cell division protein FtsX [Erysipelotrichaceae bacterium]|nr:permease-like cell division protein FtsX [Erysipelotrichaceae bacterium]
MFRRFFRHIREGFVGFVRHIGMALSSASAVTITLTLIGLFLVLTFNLGALSLEIEKSISMTAIVSYDASESMISNIEKSISSIDGISSIEFRTKDQEFDFYNETYPEMAEFNETYRESNPFHDVFLVSVEDGNEMENVKAQIERINGIDSVEDGGSNTYLLVNILKNVRIFGGALVLALCILAVYLIYNTIKITIASRETEIWIMRNVGAKNGYIRAPFLVEGIIIGVAGAIIPIALICGGYYYVYEMIGGVLMGFLTLVKPYPFAIFLALGLLGISIVVSFIGSYISVCKYLRLHR